MHRIACNSVQFMDLHCIITVDYAYAFYRNVLLNSALQKEKSSLAKKKKINANDKKLLTFCSKSDRYVSTFLTNDVGCVSQTHRNVYIVNSKVSNV